MDKERSHWLTTNIAQLEKLKKTIQVENQISFANYGLVFVRLSRPKKFLQTK